MKQLVAAGQRVWDAKLKPPGYHLCAAVVGVLALTGCSDGAGLKTGADLLKAPAGLVTGSMEALAALPIPKLDEEPVGSPIELYIRIGRGAGVCWFGTHGALKATHIFHAEAEPASRGGRSEIVIHERDTSTPNPRGNRAFRVQIIPVGDTATLDIENVRFPLETGATMVADVRRWARNDLTCSSATPIKGWDAHTGPASDPSTPTKPAKKPASKSQEFPAANPARS